MTAVQTERYYPQPRTVHPTLARTGHLAWTAILAATCTTCALATTLPVATIRAALRAGDER